MAMAKSTMAAESQEIQRKMARVRRDLHEDAQQVVRGAQSITDWKSQVRSHPWLSLGIVATVGYLLVPVRRTVTPTIVTLPAAVPPLAAAAGRTEAKQKRSGWSGLGMVFSLVAPIAVRAAQNYAMNYVEQVLAAQTMTPPTDQPANAAVRPAPPVSGNKSRRSSSNGL
jgi:hypothetical protein